MRSISLHVDARIYVFVELLNYTLGVRLVSQLSVVSKADAPGPGRARRLRSIVI